MNILSFDTSLNKTYIALLSSDKRFYKIIESDDKNYHSVYLIKEIKNILKEAGIEINNLDALSTNIGPGSFTGIRVGVTVAKVMGAELKIKTIGVSSVEILSKVYEHLNPTVVLDARRSQFYVYKNNNIELLEYEKTLNTIKADNIICDKSSFEYLKENGINNIINYEEDAKNLGEYLLDLTIEKLKNLKEDYNPLLLKPLYIQAPPIHKK